MSKQFVVQEGSLSLLGEIMQFRTQLVDAFKKLQNAVNGTPASVSIFKDIIMDNVARKLKKLLNTFVHEKSALTSVIQYAWAYINLLALARRILDKGPSPELKLLLKVEVTDLIRDLENQTRLTIDDVLQIIYQQWVISERAQDKEAFSIAELVATRAELEVVDSEIDIVIKEETAVA